MAIDWTNFTPNRIPKSPVNVENLETSVPRDAEVSGDPTEITTGPKKVFKRGYPTGKTVGVEGSDVSGGKRMPSNKADLLTSHGVTDGSQICQVLHPKGMSLLQSIASQKALLVTNDFKIVDVAAHEWPINLEAATDVRANLKATVRYGDELGVVAGILDDHVMIKSKAGDQLVAIHDLDPVIPSTELVSETIQAAEETSPQEDIEKIFEAMAPKGVVHLVHMGGPNPSWWGKHPEDVKILEEILNQGWFYDQDYDPVTAKLGEAGYSVESELEE